jgi:hypothetical protein
MNLIRKNGRPIRRTRQEAVKFLRTNIRRVGECIEWAGDIDAYGYGRISFDGKQRRAHRFAFEVSKGPIPKGLGVCHTCDNPPCINPKHLFAGTQKQNADDMVSKGRNRNKVFKGSKNGFSKMTEAKVRLIRKLHQSGIAQRKLALRFKVCHAAIFYVCKVGWKHI